MVLSEGKRVGAGKQSSMPSSELARANSILQPFPLLPLQTNKRIHSILGPGPVHTFTLGDGEAPFSSCFSPPPPPPTPLPPPDSRPLAWPAWHGLWLQTNGGEEGVSKVLKEQADVV